MRRNEREGKASSTETHKDDSEPVAFHQEIWKDFSSLVPPGRGTTKQDMGCCISLDEEGRAEQIHQHRLRPLELKTREEEKSLHSSSSHLILSKRSV